ncbi:hypothetical protein Ddc_14523 [Ditylenchus destructor]|nr:hypothetical protein Ddc_14523 [Ditylenchus destructor]
MEVRLYLLYNRLAIRELLKYEYDLDHTVKEAIENINRVKGVGTVAQPTAMSGTQSSKGALEKSIETLSSTLLD